MKRITLILTTLIFVLPSVSFAAALTPQQSSSLIAVVQSSPGTPASAFVSLITAFSNITVTQATSLIAVVQAAPSVSANAFVNLLTSFTVDTAVTQPATPVVVAPTVTTQPTQTNQVTPVSTPQTTTTPVVQSPVTPSAPVIQPAVTPDPFIVRRIDISFGGYLRVYSTKPFAVTLEPGYPATLGNALVDNEMDSLPGEHNYAYKIICQADAPAPYNCFYNVVKKPLTVTLTDADGQTVTRTVN